MFDSCVAHPTSPRQPVHDLIKGDSAAHGEPHVVTPTKSKKYVSVDVDQIIHMVDEKKMESTMKIGERNFALATRRV